MLFVLDSDGGASGHIGGNFRRRSVGPHWRELPTSERRATLEGSSDVGASGHIDYAWLGGESLPLINGGLLVRILVDGGNGQTTPQLTMNWIA
ncbi:MAG: hypothetical protein R3C56_20295 [Pirellulaceae bacterium]